MCMTFQLNKTPFLALELPRFLTFDMDQLAKHRRHHLKKRLKISKIANFESDTFSASEDIALQVAKFYRRLYGGGGGGGRFVTRLDCAWKPYFESQPKKDSKQVSLRIS